MSAEVDATDPAVVIVTWGLTWLVGKYAPWFSDRGRTIIPIVAVLLAVGVRAGIDASSGEPLAVSTVTRGIAAGAAAVMGHSQVREFQKVMTSAPSASTGEPVSSATDGEDGEE